jgi:hypothetical protein
MEKTAQQTSDQGTNETPQKDSAQMTHGQDTYPGVRPGDANNEPGSDPPAAGDVDEGDTASATATGQDGDLEDPQKKKAYNYS